MKPEEWTLRGIENKAIDFLKQYNPDSILPVPIEEILELKLNIRLVVYDGLENRFGVNGLINQSFDAIGIDQRIYQLQQERARFTMAEEVGHMVLHREWYAKHGPISFADSMEWHSSLDTKVYDYIERQAKTFAGYILAPSNVLIPKWKEFTKNKDSQILGLDQLPDNFPEFCRIFGINPVSMLLRLEKSGFLIISSHQKDILFKNSK